MDQKYHAVNQRDSRYGHNYHNTYIPDFTPNFEPPFDARSQQRGSQVYVGKRSYYQPTITRLPSLLFLLFITLGLISLIQYAIIKLPNHNSDGLLSSIANKTTNEVKEALSARDFVHAPRASSPTNVSSGVSSPGASPTATIPSSINPSDAYDVAPEHYLPVGRVAPVTSAAPTSNYIPLNNSPEPASTPEPSDYLPIEEGSGENDPPNSAAPTSEARAGGADPSNYLPVNGRTSSAAPSAYLPVDNKQTPSPAATPAPNAFLPVNKEPESSEGTGNGGSETGNDGNTNQNDGGNQSDEKGNGGKSSDVPEYYGSANPSNYQPIVPGHRTTDSGVLSSAATLTAAPTNYLPVTTPTPGAAGKSNFIGIHMTAGEVFTTSGVINGVDYAVITSAVVVDGHTYATAVPTTATLGNGNVLVIDDSGNARLGNSSASTTQLNSLHALTIHEYLTGGIVPTIVAVIFIIPWLILDASVKEMEPYYQMKHIDGVSGANSLCMNYSSAITIVATFKSVYRGHFAVFLSSLISLSVLLLAPLSSEAVYIGFIGKCTATSGRQACIPRVSVYPLAARLLQAILIIVAVLTFLLAITSARRQSGVYASPLCIAGTASLMQHPKLLKILRGLDPDTPNHEKLTDQLSRCRFRLGSYIDDNGRRGYGIKPSASYGEPSKSFKGEKYVGVQVKSVEDVQPKYQRPAWKSYFGGIPLTLLGLVAAGMLTLIVYYNQTGGDTAFERFMDSQSFGTRFLFTGIGVGMKLYWSSLDSESQRLEAYRSLMHSPCPSQVLLYLTHTNPYTGLYHSLRHRHFSTAAISTLTILCDPLTVALSNIPFAPGIPFMTYRASTYLSIGILSLMILAIIWMLFRAPMPRLVRQPDTLGSVMLYLCGSNMLDHFEGVALMSRTEREKEVGSWGGTYGFGRGVGVDGVERWSVDEVGGRWRARGSIGSGHF